MIIVLQLISVYATDLTSNVYNFSLKKKVSCHVYLLSKAFQLHIHKF